MKNPLLFPRRPTRSGIVLLTLLALLLAIGCDSGSFVPDTSPVESVREPLPPNIRLRISYDQTEATFSSLLPPGLVGSVGEGRMNLQARGDIENHGMLENYEAIHETISYDEDGYLTRTYTYTEGWQGLNMPEEAYDALKAQMPRRTPKNPVVKFKLEGGTMQFIRENGQVAASASVNPATFKVNPAALDRLEAQSKSPASVNERKAQVLGRLQQRGLALNRMSKHHVSFETRSKEHGLSSIRRVIDLRTGRPIYLVYRKDDGRPARIKTLRYTRVSGLPIMRKSIAYEYGYKDGQWTVTSRTVTTRNSISIRFN